MWNIRAVTEASVNTTDGPKVIVTWVFNPSDPLYYKLEIRDPDGLDLDDEGDLIVWDVGRMLFREAIDNNKIAGNLDVIVIPPMNGELQVLLRSVEDDGRTNTTLLIFNDVSVADFHAKSHKMVGEVQEMEIAMNKLLSKVS